MARKRALNGTRPNCHAAKGSRGTDVASSGSERRNEDSQGQGDNSAMANKKPSIFSILPIVCMVSSYIEVKDVVHFYSALWCKTAVDLLHSETMPVYSKVVAVFGSLLLFCAWSLGTSLIFSLVWNEIEHGIESVRDPEMELSFFMSKEVRKTVEMMFLVLSAAIALRSIADESEVGLGLGFRFAIEFMRTVARKTSPVFGVGYTIWWLTWRDCALNQNLSHEGLLGMTSGRVLVIMSIDAVVWLIMIASIACPLALQAFPFSNAAITMGAAVLPTSFAMLWTATPGLLGRQAPRVLQSAVEGAVISAVLMLAFVSALLPWEWVETLLTFSVPAGYHHMLSAALLAVIGFAAEKDPKSAPGASKTHPRKSSTGSNPKKQGAQPADGGEEVGFWVALGARNSVALFQVSVSGVARKQLKVSEVAHRVDPEGTLWVPVRGHRPRGSRWSHVPQISVRVKGRRGDWQAWAEPKSVVEDEGALQAAHGGELTAEGQVCGARHVATDITAADSELESPGPGSDRSRGRAESPPAGARASESGIDPVPTSAWEGASAEADRRPQGSVTAQPVPEDEHRPSRGQHDAEDDGRCLFDMVCEPPHDDVASERGLRPGKGGAGAFVGRQLTPHETPATLQPRVCDSDSRRAGPPEEGELRAGGLQERELEGLARAGQGGAAQRQFRLREAAEEVDCAVGLCGMPVGLCGQSVGGDEGFSSESHRASAATTRPVSSQRSSHHRDSAPALDLSGLFAGGRCLEGSRALEARGHVDDRGPSEQAFALGTRQDGLRQGDARAREQAEAIGELQRILRELHASAARGDAPQPAGSRGGVWMPPLPVEPDAGREGGICLGLSRGPGLDASGRGMPEWQSWEGSQPVGEGGVRIGHPLPPSGCVVGETVATTRSFAGYGASSRPGTLHDASSRPVGAHEVPGDRHEASGLGLWGGQGLTSGWWSCGGSGGAGGFPGSCDDADAEGAGWDDPSSGTGEADLAFLSRATQHLAREWDM